MVNPSQTQTKPDTQGQGSNPQNQNPSGQKDQYSNKSTDAQKTDPSASRVGNNMEKDEPRSSQDRNQSGTKNQEQDKNSDSSAATDKKSALGTSKASNA